MPSTIAAAVVALAISAVAAIVFVPRADAPEAAAPDTPASAPLPERIGSPRSVPPAGESDEGDAPSPPFARIRWRDSTSLGTHTAGRLVAGVQIPAEGRHFFTWDPIRKRSPDRPWRRWGNDRMVRMVMRVLDDFAAAHPRAPRIGIGDLSRPRGGDFGPRYGLPGHVSHQNGLDADLYYPRLDGLERVPRTAAQVDRRLSQDLVDRFVRAGAAKVFVGPNTGLTGPPDVVQAIPNHDNHLHVRITP